MVLNEISSDVRFCRHADHITVSRNGEPHCFCQRHSSLDHDRRHYRPDKCDSWYQGSTVECPTHGA